MAILIEKKIDLFEFPALFWLFCLFVNFILSKLQFWPQRPRRPFEAKILILHLTFEVIRGLGWPQINYVFKHQ